MASEAVHKQEFRIRDLSTRSVLLFPTRAQIIRSIPQIALQPGANQIVIDGLAPTVDEHSIKVEGTGSATVTEVSVDLLPNREVFEDIYPSDSEDEEESDDDDSEDEIEAMTAINEKIKKLRVTLLNEQEKLNSATNRLQICDNFGKSVAETRPPPEELETLINAYQVEREKIYRDHETSTASQDKINKEITGAEKEKTKLARALVKSNEKKEKEKAKLRQKKLRQKAERAKEVARIKAERESFWPKKVYKVTINLEPSSLTPASSRRTSIDGDTIVNLATSDFHEPSKAPQKHGEISLSLSYITYDAFWSPRYDLSLNTLKCSGSLDYGAELTNNTCETWRDAKIILSTSQTTFSGLNESIPILYPWHVRLLKGGRQANSALYSSKELVSKQNEWQSQVNNQSKKPRWENYGREGAPAPKAKSMSRSQQVQQVVDQYSIPAQNSTFGHQSNAAAPAAAMRMSAPAIGGRGGGLFGGIMNEQSRLRRAVDREEYDEETVSASEDMGFGLFDDGPGNAPQSLVFEEGNWEESGMTITYDVPGSKTLSPSNSTMKHKIAKIDFKNVVFSHMVIGKLRQVAFLKARLRNTSKITLLKGPLGLTLDGSFLGQAIFPRCSAGESFSLPLGVDPAINIAYPKPTVRRSQSGIFSKEDSNVFTRIVTIMNTKHNAPVDLTVLDQVPVSEDERLKIEIVNPRGLKPGGDGVRTGQNLTVASAAAAAAAANQGAANTARSSVYATAEAQGTSAGKWGTAVATTKKGGEVLWTVKLNPGQGVKLTLEYEATFPGGEGMVGVDT